MATRRYIARARAVSAAQTRSDILDAAQLLFVEQGYSSTTLAQVATTAGVSVQSVYGAGSKASLMTAIMERAFTGDEQFLSLLDRPEFAAIMADPDTDHALDRYVDFVVTANARIADLHHAAILAADADAAIAEELARTDLRRQADIENGIGWFVHRGLIDQGEAAEFADVLGYLTGPQTYWYFTVDRGWTADRVRQWLRHSIDSHCSAPGT